MTTGTLVICGHGMVAQRLLEQLHSLGHGFKRIVVIGGEPDPAYNRVLLSSVLAGDASPDQIRLKDDQWFAQAGIDCVRGDPVTGIDRNRRIVSTEGGRTIGWDALVIATGARAASLNLPGEDLEGVHSFRDLRDTRRLIELSKQHRRAVVIGGGFLGLEAAEGLRSRGMNVTVVHRNKGLLNRQLDPTGSELLAAQLTDRGLHIRTGCSPDALLGKQRVRAVQLDDGSLLSTDLVVLASGITPNHQLGVDAGLDCDRGILVNPGLQTSDPEIFALGECCQLGDHTFGLVDPGYQQARVLAERLSNPQASSRFEPEVEPTRLKISGIPIFSCGQTHSDADTESMLWRDYDQDRYCRLFIRGKHLIGAVLFGDTTDGPWYSEQIRQRQDITPWRASLAFGRDYCENAA
ncbi:FAD-dependent oxidoreductase [uncultured Marinobacter sp.]|uniref:NAD(P)/FAD-dependent oxidoreductase n=1 Tax=uncultured Marinobacter sp. TaxID=187379 RepID=UPI0030D83A12